MSGKIRTAALVLVLACLLAPSAHALPGRAPFPAGAGFTDLFWGWLSRLVAVWEKEGSSMDPDGHKEGSQMDPDGQKEGSSMDPNGQPHNDAGSQMDPNG
jgi:hypothetical protein